MWNVWIASLIVAQRLPRLAEEAQRLALGQMPPGRFESERMVTEKIAALQGGLVAAGRESALLGIAIATRMAFGDWPSASSMAAAAPMRIAQAAAQPANRAVAANARRFSRPRA